MYDYRITKPFPPIPSRDMLLGKVIHYVLERGWETRDDAISVLQEESKASNLSRLEAGNMLVLVDSYFKNFRHLLSPFDDIERQFKLELHNDIFLVGKMDRIAGIGIIDWKSGIVAKNLQNDIQCILYEFAYKEIFKTEPAGVFVASLKEGQLIKYAKDKRYYNELFMEIIPRMLKKIKNNDFEKAGMFNGSCYRCQWKQGCLRGSNVVDS